MGTRQTSRGFRTRILPSVAKFPAAAESDEIVVGVPAVGQFVCVPRPVAVRGGALVPGCVQLGMVMCTVLIFRNQKHALLARQADEQINRLHERLQPQPPASLLSECSDITPRTKSRCFVRFVDILCDLAPIC